MKKYLAWILYWAGDLFTHEACRERRLSGIAFVMYQRLMLWSVRVQGDGAGPWPTLDSIKT